MNTYMCILRVPYFEATTSIRNIIDNSNRVLDTPTGNGKQKFWLDCSKMEIIVRE